MAGKTLKRRGFLQTSAKAVAGAALSHGWPVTQAAENGPITRLSIDTSRPAIHLPANFAGLGYEMSSVARIGLLSTDNTPYVNLVRNLGPAGVMRFGGIVADFTSYQAEGVVATEPKRTVVTRASLEQLRAFLDRTGWGAIWSVNFGQGTLQEAIVEARDVARLLGSRLLFVELGNEVENYSRGTHPLRRPPYPFAAYRAEYAKWRDALLAEVPGLRFAAPDTAASVDWVEAMAADARGTVQLLTTHYYRGAQLKGTPEQLSIPDPELAANLQRLRAASQGAGIPWRMCETNSFFGGGRPGLSDTLLGALWTLDYMLLLAQAGCAGVNIETGVNQLGFISSYSPIQDDGKGHNSAGAPYYGMLAFAQALQHGSTMTGVLMEPQVPGLTAYALGRERRPTALVLVNRSFGTQIRVSLEAFGFKKAETIRLEGLTGLSAENVRLAEARVDASGQWRPGKTEPWQGSLITVPPTSAVVLQAPASA